MESVQLLEEERDLLGKRPAITAGSFYQSEETEGIDRSFVVDDLMKRATEILRVNPWLCGRVVSNKGNRNQAQLVYSIDIDDPEKYISHLTNDDFFEVPPLSAGSLISDYLPQVTGLDKGEPLCKFIVIQNEQRSKLALVFSLDHTIGDGCTMYTIWQMWDGNEKVRAMEVERVNYLESLQRETSLSPMPSSRLSMLFSYCTSFLRGWLRWAWRKPSPTFHVYTINSKFIAQIKEKYSTEESFVSTNDILNSWCFGELCKVPRALMVFNLRGRLSNVRKNLAGNYHTLVPLLSPGMGDPKKIRESWTSLLNKHYPCPKNASMLSMLQHTDLNITTNWATFYHQIDLPGFVHHVHMPLPNLNFHEVTPSTILTEFCGVHIMPECTIVIFKINRETHAILMSLFNDVTAEDLEKCEILDRNLLG